MKEIKRFNPEVIHVQTEFGIGIFGRIAAEYLDIPVVYTYHTKSGKPLCIMQIKEDDLRKFNKEAKNYGVLFAPVVDKTNDTGLCDVIAKQDDIPQLNHIIDKLGLSAPDYTFL